MDPVSLGILLGAAASGAAAAALRLRRIRRPTSSRPPLGAASEGRQADEIRVGTVLTHLGEEYWLAGEITFVREGVPALRVFASPERGGDRWVALTRDRTTVWVLTATPDLGPNGWPGMEVTARGLLLRRADMASAAVTARGEGVDGWEGMGRYAIFRGGEIVALFAEAGTKRLALVGSAIPGSLLERLG